MLEFYRGELAGLGAAALWAVSALLWFRLGRRVPPAALNLYKGVCAIGMLGVTLAVRGEWGRSLEMGGVGWLLLSGAIGIGVGDTAFFAALNRLGERRTVLVAETLAPPMTTLLAMLVLSELLPPLAYLGMALTLGGVAWVIVERGSSTPLDAALLKWGIAFATLAALCQAVGAVIARGVLTETDIGPLYSALVRMVGGVAMLLVWLPMRGERYVPAAVREWRLWGWIVLAAVLGTYLGIFLQQVALQYADAGIAQTLLATSSLFVLPLVMLRGEAVSLRALVGAVVAVGGIAVLFAAG